MTNDDKGQWPKVATDRLGDVPLHDCIAAAEALARFARSEVQALDRIVSLRAMIADCERLDAREEAEEHAAALSGLREDLAALEETLPLELAFLADERDRAAALFEQAKATLQPQPTPWCGDGAGSIYPAFGMDRPRCTAGRARNRSR